MLKRFAERLTAEFGSGFSATDLKLMRQFYALHAQLATTENIHAREHQFYLPSKEELQQKLAEWAGGT